MLQTLTQNYEAKDILALNKMGHKLRGSSVTCGFNRLGDLAKRVEVLKTFSEDEVGPLVQEINSEILLVNTMMAQL
jgi:HPt (histidine-containing phosphotransfer) domain-containing protein